MARRRLTRWHKAGALAPMTVLTVAWITAMSTSGFATATSSPADDAAQVDVPTTAIEQPSFVRTIPDGLERQADTSATVATLSTTGIPAAALAAYKRTEVLLDEAAPACNLSWTLVAAIGRVESNHGRIGGSSLDANGVAKPGIYGIALDGSTGLAKITDSDNGALDNDKVYDRAVGPMQFIPGTWRAVGIDSNRDGKKNPQDINDAATAAGVYLCSGGGDLTATDQARTAVKRYNNSDDYADLVLAIAKAYADGDFSTFPDTRDAAPVLAGPSVDQNLSSSERDKAASIEKNAASKPSASSKPSTGSKPSSGSGSGGSSSSGSSGSGSTPKPAPVKTTTPAPAKTTPAPVKTTAPPKVLDPVLDPITGLLTEAEARLRCTAKYPIGPRASFDQCVYDLTH